VIFLTLQEDLVRPVFSPTTLRVFLVHPPGVVVGFGVCDVLENKEGLACRYGFVQPGGAEAYRAFGADDDGCSDVLESILAEDVGPSGDAQPGQMHCNHGELVQLGNRLHMQSAGLMGSVKELSGVESISKPYVVITSNVIVQEMLCFPLI
jgi:hypothetical protein